jgi:hypothetical protein
MRREARCGVEGKNGGLGKNLGSAPLSGRERGASSDSVCEALRYFDRFSARLVFAPGRGVEGVAAEIATDSRGLQHRCDHQATRDTEAHKGARFCEAGLSGHRAGCDRE